MKITLCGSTRFEAHWASWEKALSLKGHLVYSVATRKESHVALTDREKRTLDLVHLAKVMESELVVVLDVDGYVGESTQREMDWARIVGRPVLRIGDFIGADLVEHRRHFIRDELPLGVELEGGPGGEVEVVETEAGPSDFELLTGLRVNAGHWPSDPETGRYPGAL